MYLIHIPILSVATHGHNYLVNNKEKKLIYGNDRGVASSGSSGYKQQVPVSSVKDMAHTYLSVVTDDPAKASPGHPNT